MPPTELQRHIGLKRANAVRVGGAQLKRELAFGTLSLDAALTDPRAASLTVEAALGACPGIGAKGINGICAALYLSPRRRIDALTERQRTQIVKRVALRQVKC